MTWSKRLDPDLYAYRLVTYVHRQNRPVGNRREQQNFQPEQGLFHDVELTPRRPAYRLPWKVRR